jgi:predicted nuclease of predicted toxin-antitoxin system
MNLLLDQGLPRSAARIFRDHGVDAVHTGDCGLATASDDEVLSVARRQGRIVVTLDADFHALMAKSGSVAPSVIRIRAEGLRAEALVGLLERVLDQCREDLAKGALISVTESQVRVRHLPIGHAST